jgi:hypothetical protein
VHHLFALLGILAGVLIAPSERQVFFPLNRPVDCVLVMFLTPIFNFFVVLDPLIAQSLDRESLMLWRWLRSGIALTVPIVGIWYGLSRRREALWIIGVVSFFVFLSWVVSFAAFRRGV